MSTSEDGERMPWVNNGTLMVFPRLSRTIFGRLTHLISNPTEVQAISDVLLPTQDGGNSSDTRVLTLLMREEKFWKLSAMLIKRTETLESILKEMVFINNGTLSMLMNGRVNPEKVT
jgi:hypothetical protein